MRVAHIMNEYFKGKNNGLLVETNNLPVIPVESKWTTLSDPERLERQFNFSDFSQLHFFVTEILQLMDEVGHHAVVLIDHESILVRLFTKTLARVTELDLEMAKQMDAIYRDAKDVRKL